MTVNIAVAAIRNQKGEYLLQRRSITREFPSHWEFPGGKLNPDEDSQTALRREVKEELGIKIMFDPTHDNQPFVTALFPLPLMTNRCYAQGFLCTAVNPPIILEDQDELIWKYPELLGQLSKQTPFTRVMSSYLETVQFTRWNNDISRHYPNNDLSGVGLYTPCKCGHRKIEHNPGAGNCHKCKCILYYAQTQNQTKDSQVTQIPDLPLSDIIKSDD